MSTYRERQERKAERLREWAEKREQKADAAYEGVQSITERIPFGQPILVGHHSERGARADQRRIESGMDRFCEQNARARDMRRRADGIETGAARSIYSDDVDALERLRVKLAGLEAQRDLMKQRNAEFRKAHGVELKALAPYDRSRAVPHPAYELSNLGGVISSTRKRIEELSSEERPRLLTARYEGECCECGAVIERGDAIRYYKRAKRVACAECGA